MLNELFTNKVPHAIVLIDLDNFKNVNDTYGHTAGDEVLKAFAKIMQESVNQHGVCFRYGGEEFMIILPSTTIEEAVEVAENLRVKQALAENLFGHPVTLSAGITAFSTAIKTPKQLIAIADQALYEAKKNLAGIVFVWLRNFQVRQLQEDNFSSSCLWITPFKRQLLLVIYFSK